jgi:pimeloyl-ACP methyl ester carboxylesterase
MKTFLKWFLIVLAFFIAGTLSWLLIPNRTLDKEEVKAKYLTSASRFYNWNGLQIHYTEEGSGTPVLMIHGYGGSFRNFADLAEIMKTDYRVIRVDLPGFGLSDAPVGYDHGESILEMYRKFMQDFIPDVVGDSLYVFGNSMGGWMAWEIAADRPEKVKGLVLSCAAGYEMEKIAQTVVPFLRIKPVRYFLSRGMPLEFSKNYIRNCYADPANLRTESVIAANELTNKEGNLPWMLKMAASGELPDTSKIASIRVPTLIIWGEKDNLIPYNHASRFERDIKGSEKIVYPDAGHLPMVEQPQRVYADFWKYFNQSGS